MYNYLAYSESVSTLKTTHLSHHTLAQQIISKQMMVYLSITANKPNNQCTCGRFILAVFTPSLCKSTRACPEITLSKTKDKCKAFDSCLNQPSTLVSPISEWLECPRVDASIHFSVDGPFKVVKGNKRTVINTIIFIQCSAAFIALFLLAANCQVALVTHLAKGTNVKFMSSECGISSALSLLA